MITKLILEEKLLGINKHSFIKQTGIEKNLSFTKVDLKVAWRTIFHFFWLLRPSIRGVNDVWKLQLQISFTHLCLIYGIWQRNIKMNILFM
jgi:hypothetical protein